MKQDQHKIPQVYLKKFGYQTESNQWKISARKFGEGFTRQKSIKSFTTSTNIFDIDSDDDLVTRIFEELNCDLETYYNDLLDDLKSNQSLNEKSQAYLVQLIANLIVKKKARSEDRVFCFINLIICLTQVIHGIPSSGCLFRKWWLLVFLSFHQRPCFRSDKRIQKTVNPHGILSRAIWWW